ncbi:MAG: prepilin peptidase [Pirellulales bacterium]|nr:prepilin peptidase [Pirellulales bacterium]
MPILVPIALFLVGAILGAAANFLIYRLRFQPRPISPWMPPKAKAAKRRPFDFVPIFGWLGMRRYAPLFGAGFWVRPLLVELLMGLGVAALYQYEIQGGLLPAAFPRPFAPAILEMLHYQFAAHVALIFLMVVASLIDADETIIPDSITVSGTLIGLAFAAFFPQSLLPNAYLDANGKWILEFLRLASPNPWTVWLDGWGGLAVGLGCWLGWCFALLPRTWHSRHGVRRAVQLCGARICREPFSLRILFLAIFGIAAIAICWFHGGNNWIGLATALVGMAAGGGVVWAVRIIGSAAMKREAMGFGDVTLMAAIGAFLGWQASLIIFFLAPFAALAVGLLRLVITRQREIPYGPFLCLAALGTIIYWEPIWGRIWDVFALGWAVPLVLAACFLLMPLLLFGMRLAIGIVTRILDSVR